jgi:hypothetical protein
LVQETGDHNLYFQPYINPGDGGGQSEIWYKKQVSHNLYFQPYIHPGTVEDNPRSGTRNR